MQFELVSVRLEELMGFTRLMFALAVIEIAKLFFF